MPTFVHQGVELAYDDSEGVGPALLLIHGIYVSRAQWRPQREALAPHLRLIAVDLRAHGESGAGQGPLSVVQLADDAAALLDHLGVDQVVCCGHSFGGYVAQELALRHPGRVRGLILAETLYGICSTPLEALLSRLSVALMQRFDAGGLSRALAHYFGSLSPDATQLIVDEARRHLADAAGQQRIMAASLAFNSRWRLHRIGCPTMIVTGQLPHMPQVLAQAAELWLRIPQATWSLVPNAGHLVHWDNPEAFNERVLRFFDRLADEAAAA